MYVKRIKTKIQKTKYLPVLAVRALYSRASQNIVNQPRLATTDIVNCTLRNCILHPFRFEGQTLGVLKSFHNITHSPSCQHLTSQHFILFISASCISAPTHQYFRLTKDCKPAASTIFTLFGTYFGYNHRISSILYTTHSHHFIITHIARIGPLEQCCELVGPLIIIYLTHNLLIPTPPAVQTSPSLIFVIKTL